MKNSNELYYSNWNYVLFEENDDTYTNKQIENAINEEKENNNK